jgi:hypothetical protein
VKTYSIRVYLVLKQDMRALEEETAQKPQTELLAALSSRLQALYHEGRLPNVFWTEEQRKKTLFFDNLDFRAIIIWINE